MQSKPSQLVTMLILLGVVVGAFLGYVTPSFMLAISFIGSLFLGIFNVLAIPMVLSSMVVGIALLGDSRKLWRLCGKTVSYFALTGLAAAVIGLLLVHLVRPGAGLALPDELSTYAPITYGHIYNFIEAYIPYNAIRGLGLGQYLPLILFGLVLGAALVTMTGRATSVLTFFKETNQLLVKLVTMMLYMAPVGLASLVGAQIAKYRLDFDKLSGGLGSYLATMLAATVLFGVVALPLVLKFLGERPILGFLSGSSPAILTAFGFSSSALSLPATYEAATTRNNVDERAAALVVPIGTVLNIGATAMLSLVAAVFVGQAAGMDLSVGRMALFAVLALLLSVGTAGLPMMTGAILVVMFSTAGLADRALPGVGAVILVDLLLGDRLRGALNVWGDSIGSAVIGQSFELKTARAATEPAHERFAGPPRWERRPRDHQGAKYEPRPARPAERPHRDSKRPAAPESREKRPPRSGRDRYREPERRDGRGRPEREGRRYRGAGVAPYETNRPAATAGPAESAASDAAKTEKPFETRGWEGRKPSAETPSQIPVRDLTTREPEASVPEVELRSEADRTFAPAPDRDAGGGAEESTAPPTTEHTAGRSEQSGLPEEERASGEEHTAQTFESAQVFGEEGNGAAEASREDTEDDASFEYGRTRQRKGGRPDEPGAASEETKPETAGEDEEFSSDSMSFGRAKRRRPAR